MRNFLEDFGILASDALTLIRERLNNNSEIMLVDPFDKDDNIPDEVYELPVQVFMFFK